MTPSKKFWDWMALCPVSANRDYTETEDDQKIHVFGFVVPITEGDQDED